MSVRSIFKYVLEKLSQGLLALAASSIKALFITCFAAPLAMILGATLLSAVFPPAGILAGIAATAVVCLLGAAIAFGILGAGLKMLNDLIASPEELAVQPVFVEELDEPDLQNIEFGGILDVNSAVEDVRVLPSPLAHAGANANVNNNADVNANDMRINQSY